MLLQPSSSPTVDYDHHRPLQPTSPTVDDHLATTGQGSINEVGSFLEIISSNIVSFQALVNFDSPCAEQTFLM